MSLLDELHVIRFGREYLLKALDAGQDHMDFRPPAMAGDLPPYSLREHFLHIADIGEMFVSEGALGRSLPEERYRLQRRSDGSWSLREPWLDVDSVREELICSWRFQDDHVFSHSSEELGQRIGPGSKLLADEIGWLIFHESQHRGQVMLLLRLAGVTPPEW